MKIQQGTIVKLNEQGVLRATPGFSGSPDRLQQPFEVSAVTDIHVGNDTRSQHVWLEDLYPTFYDHELIVQND